MKEVTIIGLGLSGTLLALYLARRGYQLEVFDARSDIRSHPTEDGRSINLALSCRGITGLSQVDIMAKVKKLLVPMRARAIHELSGQIKFQSFGRHQDEYINAVQRNELNKLLLDVIEQYPGVNLHFNTKLLSLNVEQKTLLFQPADGHPVEKKYECLIGADGASSCVRHELQTHNLINASRIFLPYGYKELCIGSPNQQHLAHEHLHLWPRDAYLLLGNPNLDHSVTGSLFLPQEGKNSFAELDNAQKINDFFKKSFPDAHAAMPNLIQEFTSHPTGNMSTIKCEPWYYQDHCLLIGDAAHGVVPFFGQGMNSAFEDCRILNELLDKHQDNWDKVMPAFYQARKINTDAVAQMSMENFHEIQTNIRDPRFNLKKQLEHLLMQRYPHDYTSKHVLVMFTNTAYAKAYTIGLIQAEFLEQICMKIEKIEDVNWSNVEKTLRDYGRQLSQLD